MPYAQVHQIAAVLANPDAADRETVHAAFAAVLAAIEHDPAAWGPLTRARAHFLAVTASYAPGLFACSNHPGLPRTNNGLEHVLGQVHYHERRASGRKQAAAAVVVRGAVRVITTLAARTHTFTADDLAPTDLPRWRALRTSLDDRQRARRAQRCFRHDPTAYLSGLEQTLLKPTLPA